MSLSISGLLNPAPNSGAATPDPGAEIKVDDSRAETEASLPGNNATDSLEKSSRADDGLEAANALASLAQASPPTHPSGLPSSSLPPQSAHRASVDAQTVTTPPPPPPPQRRQSSVSQLPPLEPSPTSIKQHSSSPTLEQYHHASKSPEQRRQSEAERSTSPSVKLPPLQALTGALNFLMQSQPEIPSTTLPLFIPAPVQQRIDRKSSNPPGSSKSPKSASPEAMAVSDEALKTISDEETRAAIKAASNEHGLRGSRKASDQKAVPIPIPVAPVAVPVPVPVPVPVVAPVVTPESTVPKKRAAPKSIAANKKGMAKKAPPSKKRKTAHDSNGTRSTTPGSRPATAPGKTSKSSTPVVESSPTGKDDEFFSDEEMEGSDGDGDELYCICRKPDDHSYMIACDGGCDGWYHGRCVNITELKGRLIDKYICPNCEGEGKGVTTWKPMCRRLGCGKPARPHGVRPSMYCSEDCGRRWVKEVLATQAKLSKRSGNKLAPGINISDDIAAKVGPLRPGDLKALIHNVDDIETFHALGNGVLKPPVTPGLVNSFESVSLKADTKREPTDLEPDALTDTDRHELDGIADKKDSLRAMRTALKERERYIGMAKERLAAYIEREGLKPKDLCGFDQRLGWSPERFARWRASPAGSETYERGSLILPDGNATSASTVTVTATSTAMDIDGELDDQSELGRLCPRKRCERHKHWQRLQLEEVRFEESLLADRMRELDRLEREVGERAARRWRLQASVLLKQPAAEIKSLVESA